ncbi:hypothetical protein CI610_01746 [invertebrate metagenome]|uniref:Baseplate structural protein Gp10 C-terminal domain-containing protein n=1 Tax=invertebrate metagenome TaxID=1711999 RepID=A0A2H9T7S2_9ZZZZ
MSGIIIEHVTSVDAIERNFSRLNEALVAMQGGSMALENISGYENLATKTFVNEALKKVQYAVGDIHISETETNPTDKFGYGEWDLIGKGKTLMGIDEYDDDFKTPGKTGGEKQHTLTVNEMPSHTHDYESLGSGGRHLDGEKGHFARSEKELFTSRSTGRGKPHNILQPYYCVYIWKRTA